MGIGRSKPEKYKLRTVDDEIMQGSGSGRGGTLEAGRVVDSFRISASKFQKPPSKQVVAPMPTTVEEEKPDVRKMIKMPSARGGAGLIAPQIGMKASSVVTNPKYPWLIKSANISGANTGEIEFGRVIGTGLMGFVRIARFKQAKQYFAVKAIKKDYVIRHNDERHIQNERNILNVLKSEFCVKLYGTFQDNVCIYFIMELAVGGELFRRLSKKESFPPQTAKFYATEICSALTHIHKLGWCYRDLKPENVMLDEDGHCKLVDFGFSKECGEEEMMHTVCGTPAYLSPEQLNGKFTNGYTRIVDWWAFGVFIFELLTGKTPFSEDNSETPYAIYLRILNSQISFPRNFDPVSKELISSLCCADVTKRLVNANAINSHSYFEIDWNAVKQRKLVPPFVPRISAEADLHYFDSYPDIQVKEGGETQLFEGF